jgi:thiol-disulfide isomerase/thioredoxin
MTRATELAATRAIRIPAVGINNRFLDCPGKGERAYTMRNFGLAITFLALVSAAPGQGAVETEWAKLVQLEKRCQEKPAAGENAVEFYAQRDRDLYDATRTYLQKYPNDTHAGPALEWELESADFSGSATERSNLLDQLENETQSFIASHSLPESLRLQMIARLIHQRLDNDDLITTESASHLEQKIAGYLKENPVDPKRVSLQLARVNLLYRVDPQKAKSFLEELLRDPDEQLAQAARTRLTKAELLGKQLDLRFTATDGTAIDLAQLRGKVVLIDFMASWCPDCVRELPEIQKLDQAYRASGLVILGISLDRDRQALANFLTKKSITWPIYFDGKGWDNTYAVQYSVRQIPEIWIINKEGTVETTSADVANVDAIVQRLLKASRIVQTR